MIILIYKVFVVIFKERKVVDWDDYLKIMECILFYIYFYCIDEIIDFYIF